MRTRITLEALAVLVAIVMVVAGLLALFPALGDDGGLVAIAVVGVLALQPWARHLTSLTRRHS